MITVSHLEYAVEDLERSLRVMDDAWWEFYIANGTPDGIVKKEEWIVAKNKAQDAKERYDAMWTQYAESNS